MKHFTNFRWGFTRTRRHTFLLSGLMMLLTIWMLSILGIAADASEFRLASSAFADGASIPAEFTCEGVGHSPPLSWTGVPNGTKSMVLLVEDPDAPAGTFIHWVVYGILPGSSGFKEGAAEGKEAANSVGKDSYMGPCPPPGSPHHYNFRLFALDTNLNLGRDPNVQAVKGAMAGHIIQSTDLVGMFGR
jgi:Raf kinase inhibitor-like YbhB/YbcL family protein